MGERGAAEHPPRAYFVEISCTKDRHLWRVCCVYTEEG